MNNNNNCICLNYFLNQIQSALNMLLSTSATITQNLNTPSTDSGYTTTQPMNNAGNQMNTNGDNSMMNFGFYTFLIIIGLVLLLTSRNKRIVPAMGGSKLKN